MGLDRIVGGFSRRRGTRRAVLLLVATFVVLLPGCGKSGQGAETDPEKGSDAERLNAALAQEMTVLAAYTQALPRLSGSRAAIGRRFRAHQQEYIDAITRAIRGLGGEAEAEAEAVELAGAQGADDLLVRLYELEGIALRASLDDAPLLFTAAPRTLAASLAAGHAQHLVVLRESLGVPVAAAVPEAFDSGEEPLP